MHLCAVGPELVKKRFLTSSQTRPVSLGSRLKGLRLAAAHEGRTLRTFASRAVFSSTYMPPEKMISTVCACERKLCEAFLTF